MRGILVALVSVTALVSAASVNPRKCNSDPSEAPAICRAAGSEGVLVAHERCNKFYKCSHRKPVARECPSNLLYNPILEYCDWPKDVDCGNRLLPDDNDHHSSENVGSDEDTEIFDDSGHEDPSQARAICKRPRSDGALISHEHCTKFYKCFQSHPIELKCPPLLHYNFKVKQCDWPHNVDCGSRIIPDEEDIGENDNGQGEGGTGGDNNNSNCNSNPSEAPKICAKYHSDGVLVAHEKCNHFYKCSHGRPSVHSCPLNLLYNACIKACDWPNNVKCGDRVHPEHHEEEYDSEQEDEHHDEVHGDPSQAPSICANKDSYKKIIAHELCNHYYICLLRRPFPITCPFGFHFDTKTRKCDWSKNVECDGRIIPGHIKDEVKIHDDPSKAPEICAKYHDVLVANEKCNRFYQCAGGKPVEHKCPRGLVYNYNTEKCDWLSNVECGNRIIADEEEEEEQEPENEIEGVGHDDPSKAPDICGEEKSDGVLVAHEKCNKYYICAANVPVARPCPKGLLYNPKKERCDWADDVTCGDRIPPGDDNEDSDQDNEADNDDDDEIDNDYEGNYDPSKAPEICKEEDSDGVLVAHEYCNKFYICVNSHPLARRCPKNLFFNPKKNECDWAKNVNCSGRVYPTDINSNDGSEQTRRHYRHRSSEYSYSSNARRICDDEKSYGVLVAHEYCNKFYQCVNRAPVTMNCPKGLHFRTEGQDCEWPVNVNCGDRIIPEEKEDDSVENVSEENYHEPEGNNFDDPSQAPVICAEKDSNGIHVAHEYCNSYYICDNSRPLARECPENLWYNPKTERCDWQHNVQCHGRRKP